MKSAKPTRIDHRGSLLNVGGGDRSVAIPPHFEGWRQTLLDVNPTADIVCDARKLREVVPAASCDTLYC